MQLTDVGKKIVKIVGIVAAALLLVLFGVYIGYMRFGRSEAESKPEADEGALKEISLEPFDDKDPVLNFALMEEYDFTILEIWNSDSGDCIRYISEMNMFAEECEHRDDEIYSSVAGVCGDIYDENGVLSGKRLDEAKAIAENGHVNYPQYVMDDKTKKILDGLNIDTLPAVIFINRKGEIMDVVTDMNGKELLVHMDSVVSRLMELDWEKERVKKLKEERENNEVSLN